MRVVEWGHQVVSWRQILCIGRRFSSWVNSVKFDPVRSVGNPSASAPRGRAQSPLAPSSAPRGVEESQPTPSGAPRGVRESQIAPSGTPRGRGQSQPAPSGARRGGHDSPTTPSSARAIVPYMQTGRIPAPFRRNACQARDSGPDVGLPTRRTSPQPASGRVEHAPPNEQRHLSLRKQTSGAFRLRSLKRERF